MKIDQCSCTTIDSVSREVIDACESVAQAKCLDHFGSSDYVSEKSVFSCRGKIGFAMACGLGGEPWDRSIVVLPAPFGHFVSSIEYNLREFGNEGDVNLNLETTLELIFQDSGKESIWIGSISITGNLNDPPTLRAVPLESRQYSPKTGLKSYNWKCLALCAPTCLTCQTDIKCWTICAGVCVITCGFQ